MTVAEPLGMFEAGRKRQVIVPVRIRRDHGIYILYILETMDTGPLVATGVKEFIFVLGEARIRGTVQMIIDPVAMW